MTPVKTLFPAPRALCFHSSLRRQNRKDIFIFLISSMFTSQGFFLKHGENINHWKEQNVIVDAEITKIWHWNKQWVDVALWSRTTKNPDVSTGPLVHSFVCSHHGAPPPHLLALHCSLRSRAPLRSFVHSLAHSLTPELLGSRMINAGHGTSGWSEP